MKLPPTIFTPGVWSPRNGDLPAGTHISQVDAFSTWLATRRHQIPANIGAPMVNTTYSMVINAPTYSEHLGFIFLAAGEGDVVVSCSDDSYDTTIEITGGGTTRDLASYYYASNPLSNVAVDTLHRALDITDQNTPHKITVDIEVPIGVYIWEFMPVILPRVFGVELPGGVSAGASYYADSVPVAYWNMEDGSGSTVSDVSSAGNALDGTKASGVTGQPLWDTTNKVRGSSSLDFDHGDDDAVIVSDDAALDFSTDDAFSISCWIKRPGSADAGTVVGMVTKMAQSSSVDSPFEGYALWFNDTQQRRPSFLLYRNDPTLQQLRVQASSLQFADTDTDWHHILVTYNGNSDLDGVTMYIDGSSVTTSLESADTLPTGTDITTATDLCLGGFIDNASSNSRIYSFTGNMDEVAIWDKELSADEVSAVYNSGNGVDLTNGIPEP